MRLSINQNLYIIICFLFLQGCLSRDFVPIYSLNNYFSSSKLRYINPQISGDLMALLIESNGINKLTLFDLKRKGTIFLPGIKNIDSDFLSVSISAKGNKLAFITTKNQKNQLFLYDRKTGFIRKISINPNGMPVKVSISAVGTLAVQVLREGRFEIDIIQI